MSQQQNVALETQFHCRKRAFLGTDYQMYPPHPTTIVFVGPNEQLRHLWASDATVLLEPKRCRLDQTHG